MHILPCSKLAPLYQEGNVRPAWPAGMHCRSIRQHSKVGGPPAGLCSFMVNLIFSAWIKFPAEADKRDALLMTGILSIGLFYILGVNLRWWHSIVAESSEPVSPALPWPDPTS